MRRRALAYKTKHLMVLWGDDFKFKRAGIQFRNMDLLMQAVRADTGLNIDLRYSTPREYFEAVYRDALTRDVKFMLYSKDFFPYADNADSYWTGYYTTRPTLKVSLLLSKMFQRQVISGSS